MNRYQYRCVSKLIFFVGIPTTKKKVFSNYLNGMRVNIIPLIEQFI